MPRTVAKSSPALEIMLDGAPDSYRPGDVITGRVSRSAAVVSSQASVIIELHGRSKSKMTVSRGQAGTSIYRNRFNFFEPEQNRQQLFHGPIHIPTDGEAKEWSFAVQIPSGLDPAAVAKGNVQKHSYLPLGTQDVASHPMPPVFHTSGVWMTTTYHCYVEYFLEARLQVESSGDNADKATLPVNIIPASTPDLITDFNLTRRSFLARISTHRLMPGMENADLSFHQRTQKFFGSSKVPQLAFSVQVDCPSILQLGNHNHIPFRVHVTPDHSQSTDAIKDSSVPVTLTAMTFEIKAATKMICRGTIASHTSSETRRVGFDLKPVIAQLQSPIVLPSGEKTEPLDIGELLDLKLASVAPLGRRLFSSYKGQLYPSFDIYNIKHTHRLKWALTLSAAGESTELSSEEDITLLPLSGLPLADPDVEEQPPLYELPSNEEPPQVDWSNEKQKDIVEKEA